MATLTAASPCDSVLLEWQCALELRARGSLHEQGIVPLLVGGPGPDGVAAFPQAAADGCPDTVHGPTAAAARTHLGGAAPVAGPDGAPAVGSGTVRAIVQRITAPLGHYVTSWATAAAWLEALLRTHPALSAPPVHLAPGSPADTSTSATV